MLSTMKLAPALIVVVFGTGCIIYSQPQPDEPHAIVKFRRVFHKTPGESLDEKVTLGYGFKVLLIRTVNSEGASGTKVFRMHPKKTRWFWSASFSHKEKKEVKEKYTERERVWDVFKEEYVYKDVDKERTVTKEVKFSDGGCSDHWDLAPLQGHIYLLQISYMGEDVCSITCLEQVRVGANLKNQPCSKQVYQNE